MGLFLSREEVREELRQQVEQAKAQLQVGFDERIGQMESTLLDEMRKGVQQHSHPFPPPQPQPLPQLSQIRNRMDDFVNEQVKSTERLSSLGEQIARLTQIVDRLSPTSLNGEPKPIHAVIRAHTQRISDSLDQLHYAFSSWQIERSQEMGQAARFIRELDNLVQHSQKHLTPSEPIIELLAEPSSVEQENHKAEEPNPLT